MENKVINLDGAKLLYDDLRDRSEVLSQSKANKDGYYPSMHVGLSDNLNIKNPSIGAEFMFRTTGGTADVENGYASVESIEGNTLVWNQLFRQPNTHTNNGITMTYYDGVLTLNGTATNSYSNFGFTADSLGINKNGHLYLLRLNVIKNDDDISISVSFHNNRLTPKIVSFPTRAIIGVCDSSKDGSFGLQHPIGTVLSDVRVNIELFDLTQMFGAGNEPSTIALFEAMFPLNYYAYNAGELLNFNGTGIKTIGFNAFNLETSKAKLLANNQYQITGTYTSATSDAETITIDADGKFTPTKNGTLTVIGGDNTTCVHLVWSGYRNGEYEPYWEETRQLPSLSAFDVEYEDSEGETQIEGGLKSINNIYDEQTLTQDILKIGVLDLGALNWTMVDQPTPSEEEEPTLCIFYSDAVSAIKNNTVNLKNVKFNVSNKAVLLLDNNEIRLNSSKQLYVRCDDYEDAASFKAAMGGVLLYYELETPVITTYENKRNLSYRVDDFGTEALLPENDDEPTTTSFIGQISYGVNAADAVKNLDKNFTNQTTLDSMIEMLHNALAGTITKTWNSTTNSYDIIYSGGALGDINGRLVAAQEAIDGIITDKNEYYKGAPAIIYGIGTYTLTPNSSDSAYTLNLIINIEGNGYNAIVNVAQGDTIIEIFKKFKSAVDTITDVFGFRFELTCNASTITIKCNIKEPVVITSFACTGGTIDPTTTTPTIIPDFAGQRYINTAQKKKYTSVNNSAVSDWLED